ncbi:zona pellucida glycoprotein 3d tandem duplicate 1 [Misgurnus anguillicaudatus]|uniref:zona pellucida glycoprotein 3d tandem duplicate 1 n=1 Tax=Misgurnus anguillicaudatus TaxID=75329 RepID=UPI003CCF2DA2
MMGRTNFFCFPLYLLVLFFIPKTEMFGGPPKYSKLVSTEQKALPMSGGIGPWTGDSEFNKPPPVMRPYHVFPMFDHVPVPLVDMELFRPVAGRRHLPSILSSLLIPQVNPQRIQVSPVRNTRGVEVWCGYSKVSVRVNKRLLGFRSSPGSFYLGTCSASRSDNGFIYFHYDLNQCDSSLTMMNGQIMYSNTIQYIPEPQGTVIRAVPLTLNIQCLYNRFHYSYKMGYLPVIREHMFYKSFESSVKFTISVCNERWEILGENESFMLGEPMYFEVSAARIFEEERVFVDSCYATSSKDPNSTPKHSVIHNYGCMEDSRRDESLSRFIQRESNFIRFSVDAFLLPQVTGTHFHLHCLVSVHNTTASVSAKSCTYNSITEMWEELYADASVCACCEATCEVKTKSSLPHVRQSLITSKSWILNKTEESLTQTEMREWVGTQDSTKDVKFKSAQGINEEDEDYTEEIVTDPKEQMETREKDKEKLVNHGEIEVIAGTKAALAISEFQYKVGRSGKVVFLGERMEKSTDAGSVRSTIVTDTVKKPNVQLSDEPLEDANNDTKSSESLPKEEKISKDEMQSDDLEETTRVQSTIQSQMVIDEDVFLNAKQEPKEWNEDAD